MLSDHFSSSCAILESTIELLAVDLTVLDVEAFSFFAFLGKHHFRAQLLCFYVVTLRRGRMREQLLQNYKA